MGEIKVVFFAFVVEHAEQSSVEGHEVDLRASAADVEHAVFQILARFLALQTIGREPDPRTGEVASPVLVRVAVAFFGRNDVLSAVEHDRPGKCRFHSFGVPVHSEGFGVAQGLARAITDVEGDLLVDGKVPGHFAGVAHPFGVGGGVFWGDEDTAFQHGVRRFAVAGLHAVRRLRVDRGVLYGEETVELGVVFPPGTGFYHKVRGLFTRGLVLGKLSERRFVFGKRGIADKEFDEEGLIFSGFRVLRGERMPPPVVAATRERAVQHKRIPREIVSIEHIVSLRTLFIQYTLL